MRNLTILKLLGIFLLGLLKDEINGAKILAIYPYMWRSHHILGTKLMKGLANAGHNITYVSSEPTTDIPTNYSWTDVILEGQAEAQTYYKARMLREGDKGMFKFLACLRDWTTNITKAVFTNPTIQKYIQSGETFDAIIADQGYGLDILQVFSHYFGGPFILATTLGPNEMVRDKVCNPAPISTVSSIISFTPELTQTFSFRSRLKNLILFVASQLVISDTWKVQSELLKELCPGAPNIDELFYNTSLVLSNSHLSVLQPEALVPNVIEVGGYHIDPPKKLPSDLQEFLDGAKDGAVYFSLGSEINSEKLSEEKQKEFLQVFAGLKQRVLWKFDKDIIGKPKNVLIKKWMPQQDILAHPNVKLFITHGGLLSTTEAIYNGKPTLCIYVFGDQPMNCHLANQAGYSLLLDLKEISSEKIKPLIEELLENPRYLEVAKKLSRIFHDRPMSPLQTAIYWVEYVIRHKGAPHLRVAGIGMPFYKYYMIDVFALLLGCIFVSLILVKWSVKFMIGKRLGARKIKSS